MTLGVEQQAGERARALRPLARSTLNRVGGKLGLHRVPKRRVDDRLVFGGIGLLLVDDLAAVDPVLQHQIEGAAGERLPAPAAARGARPLLAPDARRLELLLEQPDGAERRITPEDVPHRLGLGGNDDELAIAHRVAERRHAAHPHPLLLRCRDLVADALAGELALELGEGEEHVQREAPHRGRRVELLGHRDEGHALRVEDLDDLGEVGERARQAVDLVGDQEIDFARLDVGEELLQGRSVHRAAGVAAIVVMLRQHGPALVPLALDEGLAGLALGMQRVELLLQPLLGGFAGVDRATECPPGADRCRPTHHGSPQQRFDGRRVSSHGRSAGRTNGRR